MPMLSRLTLLVLGLLIAWSAAPAALAQQKNDPAPDYTVNPGGDNEFDLIEAFRGKVILFVAFNMEDSSSRELLTKLREMRNAYERRGLRVWGITRQSKKAFDEEFESRGRRGRGESTELSPRGAFELIVFNFYPENPFSFPAVGSAYLIDPHGKIAFARFDAREGLEEKIQRVLQDTPTLAASDEVLQKNLAALSAFVNAGKFGSAYTLAEEFRRFFMESDPDREREAEAVLEQVLEGMKTWLEDARRQIREEDYAEAAEKLAIMSVRLRNVGEETDFDKWMGSELRREAQRDRRRDRRRRDRRRDRDRDDRSIMTYEELKEQVERELGMLQTDAYTKSIVRKALDEAEASRDLEAAQRLPQRDMRLALDEVIREYPNTEAATKAQAIVDSLWGDPRMRKFIVREREKEKAMRWYEIGERYAEAELFDLAREQLRKVISEFPGSAAAEKAQERLATLDEDKEKAERREAARAALQRRISSDRDGDG